MVGPDDPVGLARAIDGLVADTTERHRLGKAGRVAVDNQASPERFARTQMQAYTGRTAAPTLDGTGHGTGSAHVKGA